MAQDHLSTRRLLAIRDGNTGDRRDLQHLASCPECQEGFDDNLWLSLMAGLKTDGTGDGPHPSADELLAYRNHALSRERLREVREHLKVCRACTTSFARARAADKRSRYSSPPPHVLRTTMERFRPGKLRRLGTLFLERLGEGWGVFFRPEPRPPRRNIERFSALLSDAGLHAEDLAPMEADSRAHPSSARRRAERLAEKSLDEQRACSTDPDDWMPMLDGEAIASHRLSIPDTARIEAELWTVRVRPVSGDEGNFLAVKVASNEGRSVQGVRVRLLPEHGNPTEAELDREGSAVLPCPSVRSRLVIDVDPPLAIDVEVTG